MPQPEATYTRLAMISINEAEFSVRTVNALQRCGHYKTLLDLDKETDDNLFRVPNLGPKCVKEIRDAIRTVRAQKITMSESVLLWAQEHETLILALMNGEAVIALRSIEENALRAALEPFAEVARWADRNNVGKRYDCLMRSLPGGEMLGHLQVQAPEFSRARDVLAGMEQYDVPIGEAQDRTR